MVNDIKTLATIGLLLQVLLIVTVLIAAYLAKIKRQLIRHCKIVRWTMVVQLLTILMMVRSMSGYLENPGQVALRTEMLVHHSLGILVILLWVYINLAVMGRVRVFGRLAIYMRASLSIWLLAFLLGLHLYFRIYLS